ncbi:MAG: LysR family transcriptional regulator [Proteobacteria bacterium]|nr:LysR family transcriptional regulator [Pseudomonadota bacterium]
MNQLTYFTIVAQTGSMHKAAELLRLSPSSLSRGIACLENEMGCTLFDRVGRGIEINDAGRKLYSLSQKLLSDFDGIKNAVKSSHEVASVPFAIGSFEVFSTYFLGEFVSTILPNNKIRFMELVPGDIEKAVLDQVVDIGLTYAPMPHRDLEFLKVGHFEMASFMRRNSFEGMQVQDVPYAVPITPLKGSVTGYQSLDCWPSDRYSRNIQYECELLESALELARSGVAALHCPRFIVNLHNRRLIEKFQLIELKMPSGMRNVKMDTYIVKLRTKAEDKILKKVAKGLRLILK